MSAPLETVYCTDEDIAIKAGGDLIILAPKYQLMASGTDGVIAANSWVINSASGSFVTFGIEPGHVIWLNKPTTVFPGNGDLFGVDSVTTTTITMHRIGFASGEGRYPVISTTTAIAYSILTLYPQIEQASFDLNRTLGIDTSIPGRTPSDLHDLRDLKDACVLKVLILRYAGEIREMLGNAWGVKLTYYTRELEQIMGRLRPRWAVDGGAGTATPPMYSTRIVR